MIAIIDYKTGNLRSVENALNRLGAEWTLTADAETIRRADRVLLPGVGHAGEAIGRLREAGLDEVIKRLRRPVLGICVGMQVMCRHTDEGDADGIGLFDTRVRRFQPQLGDKVPHMGWNSISNLEGKLFKGIEPGSYVYYVHSFRADLCPDTIATTRYGAGGRMFSAALKYENFYGTQFHPEKSGDVGEKILKNFLSL
ncbi:imidazole glycerol phosphate synthase subunit HisH [Muribaculaceae bacterium Isolate-002 (NCI)]|nr:imidazole glycerol phosphate synthase subunit HisH [Muribaculaceae bacterium Isolate-002 (NCI)]